MRYQSVVTQKGNSSYSFTSQDGADARAAALDAADCTNCTNCINCTYCTNCSGCRYCRDCSGCTDCRDCMDCSGEVIQAGRPNNWTCYGWLKDDKLLIHCGCRCKTYVEAVEYWSNKPDRTEVLAACNYIAEIARLRGWNI